jgi:hypothetical protein
MKNFREKLYRYLGVYASVQEIVQAGLDAIRGRNRVGK